MTARDELTRVYTSAATWACSLAFTTTVVLAQETPIRCDTPPAEACAVRHGRLTSRQGIPYQIWLIGTKRMIAVDNEPVVFLPGDSARYLEITSPDYSEIFGDFTICPLEPDRPGHLRRACVTSAKNLVVHHLKDDRAPFRIRSTWSNGGSARNPR